MMNDKQMLHEFVLEAMANDYESFECVVEQVTLWGRARDREFTREETTDALEWVIRKGYAQAYLLSAQPPHTKQVVFSHELLEDLWFYVTRHGKQLVKDLEDQVSEQ
jgi:hypothetical protein